MSVVAVLTKPIPQELVEEFLKRLPYVSEGLGRFELLPGLKEISFDLRPGFEEQAPLVAKRIDEIAGKLCLNYRPGVSKTLIAQKRLPSGFCDDPHPLLKQRGELIAFGRGRYGVGGKLLALMEWFEHRVQQMAKAFDAQAYSFPALVGADTLDRCKYLKNFPASLNMVCHLREDHDLLTQFVRSVEWEQEQLRFDKSSLSGVECLLSPSVCFHWYAWLQNLHLAEPRAVTALGKCFRYESANLTGLERLWDFTMREIIFVGSGEYVLDQRRVLVELSEKFLTELGLAFEISTATDPFFVDSYAVQAAYQQGFDLKFELLAPLPYSGKLLAVGSINYHQDFFGRSFNIEIAGGAAHTGCIGFGYERLALAFVAQHGVDERNWPERVRKVL